MRKISLVFVAAMLLSAGQVFANDSKPPETKKELSYEIGELLKKGSILVKDKDLTAKVLFTINKENEIVVLAVEADNKSLEVFVKRRLNYKKVNFKNFEDGKKYVIPVRVTV